MVTGNDEEKRPETAQQSILRLKRLIQLAPQDTDLRYHLARQLVATSQFHEAIPILRSIIAVAPNHLEARKLLDAALHPQVSRPG